MAIKIKCRKCEAKFSVKDAAAGRRVKCRECGAAIKVPVPKTDEEELLNLNIDAAAYGDEASGDDPYGDDASTGTQPLPRRRREKSGSKRAAASGGKKSSGSNRGLIIGLSAGGGLLVIALLALAFWPEKPGPDVADASDGDNAESSSTTDGDSTSPTDATTTNPSTPATAATSEAQFDFKAWQQASAKLTGMKIFFLLEDNPPLPDGLTHVAIIDPVSRAANGSISAELWEVISSVSHVVVRTSSINDATVRQLSHHPGLVGLNISGRSTVTAAGIAELKNCPNLRILYLNGVPVSPELLNAIAQLGELSTFGINDTPVSSEMVNAIAKLSKLESLSLQNAGITDGDLAQIVKLTRLRTLFLDKSKVTGTGLQTLKILTNLTMFSVRGSGISPQALADFEAAVPECRVLK